ncbi:MAG: OB-fold domain-containing protein [Actinomycetota bacterium]|nr:OB-fold domain-containing protein [Actinomycetota bacterium]
MTTEVSAPLPLPNELTKPFWEGAAKGQLVIQRCNACGHLQHAPEPVCSACLSFDLGSAAVSGTGTVYTFCIATQAFHPYFEDKLPFVIAVVELDDQPGLKMITNIVDVDPDSVRVGDRVGVTFNLLGEGFMLPVFRPIA